MTPEEKLFNRVKIAFVKARIPKPITTVKSLMEQINQDGKTRAELIDCLLAEHYVGAIVRHFAEGDVTKENHKFWHYILIILVGKNL